MPRRKLALNERCINYEGLWWWWWGPSTALPFTEKFAAISLLFSGHFDRTQQHTADLAKVGKWRTNTKVRGDLVLRNNRKGEQLVQSYLNDQQVINKNRLYRKSGYERTVSHLVVLFLRQLDSPLGILFPVVRWRWAIFYHLIIKKRNHLTDEIQTTYSR